MPPSKLLTSILEQAKEPLYCLNGAGYFTEEEWVKLDLIINKKHTWTNGPSNLASKLQPQGSNNAENPIVPKLEAKPSEPSSSEDGNIPSSIEDNPKSLPAELPASSLITATPSSDAGWDLAPELSTPASVPLKLLEPSLLEQRKLSNNHTPSSDTVSSGFSKSQMDMARSLRSGNTGSSPRELPLRRPVPKLNPALLSQKSASGTTRTIETHKSPQLKTERKRTVVSAPSIESRGKLVKSPKPISTKENLRVLRKDVNTFETSNAAEWDEAPTMIVKKSIKKDTSISVDKKADKMTRADTGIHINQVTRHGSSSLASRLVTRSSTEESILPSPTRSREGRELKPAKDQNSAAPAKPRICWFWAVSPGGCRYRSGECINLHLTPTPELLQEFPLSKAAVPKNPPVGVKPKTKTCWSWATTGTCDKGEKKCEYVHGWVVGGTAPRP